MLPANWKATELGEIAKFSSGGTPSKENADFWGGVHPWITAKDLKQHYLKNSIDTLTDAGVANAKLAPAGASLILVRGMTLLKDFPVGYVTRPMSFNQDIKALIPEKEVDGLFLSFFLASQKEKMRQLVSIAGHGTGRLDTESIKSFPVNLPSLGEQKKIAKILSTWDQAISTTERLLANSQQQKKALMQQLLAGKTRFSKFEGEWRHSSLSSIVEVIISPVDKKSECGEVAVNLCNYTDVYKNNYITSRIKFMNATAKETEIEKYFLKKGDVIITKDSETPGDIAISALVSEELNNVLCGYHLAILRPNKNLVDSDFLNFLFSLPITRYYFFTLATGATRFGLSIGGIKNAHFNMPSLEEQKRIAQVLTVANSEIEILQQKLACLKQEKKALMQQLLTGKRRVKVDES
jgi:type I restriction enzyme S subunit